MDRFADERDVELPLEARQLVTAFFAMANGLSLEQLTQPEVVDSELNVRVQQIWFDTLANSRGRHSLERGE